VRHSRKKSARVYEIRKRKAKKGVVSQGRRDERDTALRRLSANPTYARAPAEASDLDLTVIFDDPQLGADIQLWHIWMGDPLYKIGSLIYEGYEVPVDLVEEARNALERIHRSGRYDLDDEDSLLDLINNMNYALRQAGVEVDTD